MSTPFRTCARSHAVRNGMKPCSKRSVVIWRPRAGTLPCVRNVTCTEYSLKHSLEQRPTLLLVDDEASNLQVLRHTLQHDYRLLFAKDGPTALELGAVDYIIKPFSPHIVKARVRTHLRLVSVEEVVQTRLEIVRCLGKAAEYKDNETGAHVLRMSHYSRIVALALGLSDA